MAGWVYLFSENGDNEMYKIGVTRSDNISNRIKKLQTGNGNEILLRYKFKSEKPFKLEKMLHNYYQNDREDGEWFLLSKEQVAEFDKKCQEFERNIEALKENPFFNSDISEPSFLL